MRMHLVLAAVLLSGLGTMAYASNLAADAPQKRPGEAPREIVTMPGAPSVQALAMTKGQVLYAGSFGFGVFRSEDQGTSWTAINQGLSDPFIYCLAASDDGVVYVGTVRGGVFQSRDSGKSWQQINAGLKRLEVKTLLIANGAVYAGTGDGVYRYSQEHNRWNPVTKGLDDTLVYSLAMGPDRVLFAGTSGKGLYRHIEANGWTRLSRGLIDHEGLIENFIRVLLVDKDQTIYVGTFDGGVFRSGDGGQSWRAISRALPNDSIRAIVISDNGVIVATGRGVFKTIDQGRQWKPLNKGLTELSIQVLIASGSGLYAGTSSGIFRSLDEGQSWVGISEGLVAAEEGPKK